MGALATSSGTTSTIGGSDIEHLESRSNAAVDAMNNTAAPGIPPRHDDPTPEEPTDVRCAHGHRDHRRPP
jgi:hypothetical protein